MAYYTAITFSDKLHLRIFLWICTTRYIKVLEMLTWNAGDVVALVPWDLGPRILGFEGSLFLNMFSCSLFPLRHTTEWCV